MSRHATTHWIAVQADAAKDAAAQLSDQQIAHIETEVDDYINGLPPLIWEVPEAFKPLLERYRELALNDAACALVKAELIHRRIVAIQGEVKK